MTTTVLAPALPAGVAARPRSSAVLLLAGQLLLTVFGALVLAQLVPGWSPQARSLAVVVMLAVGAVWVTTALGGFAAVGVNHPAMWRDRRLLLLPAALAVVPLLHGVRPLATVTVLLLVSGYLVTGFFEELWWRGVVLRVLAPTGALPAALMGSLLFGAAHLTNVLFRDSVALVLAQAVGAACFGVGYAALRIRTGTVVPLMVLHLATDLFAAIGALPAIPILVAQDVVLLGFGLFLLRRSATHDLRSPR